MRLVLCTLALSLLIISTGCEGTANATTTTNASTTTMMCGCCSIPTRGEHESSSQFNSRLNAQQRSAGVIQPRGEHESSSQFNSRVNAQITYTPKK